MVYHLLEFLIVAFGPHVKLTIFCADIVITPLQYWATGAQLSTVMITFDTFPKVLRGFAEVSLGLEKWMDFSRNIISMWLITSFLY